MDPITIGYIGVGTLIVLILVGVPVAYAIGATATVGNIALIGWSGTSAQVYQVTSSQLTNFLMLSVPMFILMGQLFYRGNLGKDLYDCVYRWVGRLPGGLALASILTCGGFGAVTGVSSAAVATTSTIVMPEMKRYGYSMALSSGAVATASALAILIPPSLILIIYGLWTNTSIGRLFLAGIVPALMLMSIYVLYIVVVCSVRPELGPKGERFSFREKVYSLRGIIPVAVIFLLVIGGLYVGWFTPGEAGAVGAAIAFLMLLVMRRLEFWDIVSALSETAKLTAMLLAIFIAVSLFSRFVTVTGVTGVVVHFFDTGIDNVYLALFLIILIFIGLGMFFDGFSVLLLTLPFLLPVIEVYQIDLVWFGIFAAILIEIGLVTPPVGLNCFVLRKAYPDVDIATVFRGAAPFILLTLFGIGLLVLFPQLALWLPEAAF